MPRVTKGVFSSANPPKFTDDELGQLRACLGGVISPETLAQAWELRQAYFSIVSGQEQMPTLAETNALRRNWVRSIEAVEKVALSASSGGDEARADQALRQLLGAEYGESVGELVRAVVRLRTIVGKTLDDDANIADIRSWQAAGLRAVLWFLHEPVEGGVLRGKSLGLAMGSGAGRGAPRLHDFLSVVTSRRISGDDVKNAIDFMTKHDRMPKPGNSPSGFGAAVTEYPVIW